MAKELRILIYQEDGIFVGQCLEHDLCVQGCDLDEIRVRIQRQVNFYFDQYGGLDNVPPAPNEFFLTWDETDIDPHPTEFTLGDQEEMAKIKVKDLPVAA